MAGLRFKLLAGTALTLAGLAAGHSASADTAVGWYVAADVGQSPSTTQSLDISDVTLTTTPTSGSAAPLGSKSSLKLDYGFAGNLRGGYRFTRNLRGEVELGSHPGKLAEGLAGEQTPAIGSLDRSSAMFNLIYDVVPDWAVHPYIGIGAGIVQGKTNYTSTVTGGGHSRLYSMTSSQSVPASQVLAGASWYVADHLRLDMTYRYMQTGTATTNVAVADTYAVGANTVTDKYTAKSRGNFNNQTLTVGLRWTFGASPRARIADNPPPPLPAPKPEKARTEKTANADGNAKAPLWGLWPFGAKPAKAAVAPVSTAQSATPAANQTTAVSVTDTTVPAAPTAPNTAPDVAPVAQTAADQVMAIPETREFTVYFPFNSARLNNAAQSVVSEAAQYAKQAPSPKVSVTGYTDTSGSAAYNLILSKRRANAVASGLKAEGVPDNAITISGKGEAELAVPTGNGVPKPANRRTVIEVSF